MPFENIFDPSTEVVTTSTIFVYQLKSSAGAFFNPIKKETLAAYCARKGWQTTSLTQAKAALEAFKAEEPLWEYFVGTESEYADYLIDFKITDNVRSHTALTSLATDIMLSLMEDVAEDVHTLVPAWKDVKRDILFCELSAMGGSDFKLKPETITVFMGTFNKLNTEDKSLVAKSIHYWSRLNPDGPIATFDPIINPKK